MLCKLLLELSGIVVPRAPLNAHELLQQIAARQDAATANVWRPWILPLEAVADSSTQLRSTILAGAALDHTLIDPHVLAYIKQHSLYVSNRATHAAVLELRSLNAP